jgi:integrase
MAGKPKELTAIEVKRLTDPGLHAVGMVKGLYLKVAPGGSRSWILRVTVGSKRRDIGLGGYPEVTLQRARERTAESRELIRQGVDPVDKRKADRAALISAQAKVIEFKDAAIRCHASKAPEFRNVKHRGEWINTLERYAFPVIGSLPVSEIELPHILKVLEPIWHTKTETASRVRQRMEAVLTWAAVSKYRSGDNPARWVGNLKELLPAPSKISTVKHHAALPWQQVGQFMDDLRKRDGIAAKALEFAILTAARSGEVRGMEWSEVDFSTKVWTVPEDRIKAGKQHRVPLSDDAIAILKAAPRFTANPLVFVAPKGGVLSDATLLAVVRRMKVDAVPHGFRSSFKDWARSCTAYPDEVSELALAHVNSDSTRAAYARDELLPKRKKLMGEWAKFCSMAGEKGIVTPLRRGKSG